MAPAEEVKHKVNPLVCQQSQSIAAYHRVLVAAPDLRLSVGVPDVKALECIRDQLQPAREIGMTLRAVTRAVIDGQAQVTPFFVILLGDSVCFDLLSQPVQRMSGLVGWFIFQ